jgi:hypothetical protein
MTDTETLIEEARRSIETPAERRRRMTRERVRRWRARQRQEGEMRRHRLEGAPPATAAVQKELLEPESLSS